MATPKRSGVLRITESPEQQEEPDKWERFRKVTPAEAIEAVRRNLKTAVPLAKTVEDRILQQVSDELINPITALFSLALSLKLLHPVNKILDLHKDFKYPTLTDHIVLFQEAFHDMFDDLHNIGMKLHLLLYIMRMEIAKSVAYEQIRIYYLERVNLVSNFEDLVSGQQKCKKTKRKREKMNCIYNIMVLIVTSVPHYIACLSSMVANPREDINFSKEFMIEIIHLLQVLRSQLLENMSRFKAIYRESSSAYVFRYADATNFPARLFAKKTAKVPVAKSPRGTRRARTPSRDSSETVASSSTGVRNYKGPYSPTRRIRLT